MKLKFWAQEKPLSAVKIDVDKMTSSASKLEEVLLKRVIGQERAVKQFVKAYEAHEAGIGAPDRPLATLLFLGPTGVGKTRIVEVLCEHLWGDRDAFIKIDCAEFQHSHETAKLIGAPPGYVGYAEKNARISKEKLEKHWKKGFPEISVLLFDEIEKAHDNVFKILLGMLDKGRVTLGNGEVVDLRRTIIIMTSNLAANKVSKHLNDKGIGYGLDSVASKPVDEVVYRTSIDEVKKFFSPEFVNRLDRIVVFRSLSDESMRKILDLEIAAVQDRILLAGKFIMLDVSNRAKEFLLKEGLNVEYGARELRRAIERFLVPRLARAIATSQIDSGDMLLVDKEPESDGLCYEALKGVVDLPQTTLYPTKHVDPNTPQPTSTSLVKVDRKPKGRLADRTRCSSCATWYDSLDGHICPTLDHV